MDDPQELGNTALSGHTNKINLSGRAVYIIYLFLYIKMHDYVKVSFILVLFYFPFLFLLLVPTNSYLANITPTELHETLCSYLSPISILQCKPPSMTIAVIKPDGMSHQQDIIDILKNHHFKTKYDKTLHLTPEQVAEWYYDKHDASYYPELVAYLTRSDIRVLQLTRIDAVAQLRKLIGPTDSVKARQLFPKSIRALYGTDMQENAIHASDSDLSAEREFNLFFQ
jgi:nucleoside diphosphate kinase